MAQPVLHPSAHLFCLVSSLSALTALGWTGLRQLNQFSLLAASVWMASTFRLSNLIPRQAEAQAVVEKRQHHHKEVSKKKE